MKPTCLSTAIALVLLTANTPSHAQTADSPADTDMLTADGAASGAGEDSEIAVIPVEPLDVAAEPVPAPPTDGVVRLEEIVVTAQKRKQSLQDVPVSVSVINQDQLESQNITDVSDLARAIPSVEINGPSGNYNSKMSIRGLSTESYSRTAEQAVSFVLDGVVLGKAPTTTLFDIDHVEVLRGPQGTLFGKNASAGVVSIVTNAPNPGGFDAAARIDLGSEYGYRLLQGAVNIPISYTSALRINVGQTYYTGFIHNNARDADNEQDTQGVRARFLWDITDDLTLNLIADFEKQFVSEQTYLLFREYVDRDTQEPQPLPDCGGAYATPDNLISCNGDPNFADRKAYGYSAQLDWSIGDYTITSISALRHYEEHSEADVDGLPGDYFRNGNIYDNRVLSHEIRLASPAEDQLSYVFGLYYFDTEIPNLLNQTIGTDGVVAVAAGALGIALCADYGICLGEAVAVEQPNEFVAKIRSEAAFGELTYRLSDDLRVIAGGRYTRDDVDLVGAAYAGFGSQFGLLDIVLSQIPIITVTELAAREKVSNFSWKLGVQFDFSPDIMTYFTASEGYKGPQIVFVPPVLAPAVNNGAVTRPHEAYTSIVRPEYPRAYELGIKTRLFDGALIANASLFHTTVKDYQSSQFNDNAEFVPINISEVVSQGFELDVMGFLAEGWRIGTGLLLNKATYPDGYRWPCTQMIRGCEGTSANDLQDIGGEQLAVAPKVKVTFSSEYERQLFSFAKGFVSTDVVFRSSTRFMPNFDTRTQVGDRTVVGARLGLRSLEAKWELSLFGRNLTNEHNPTYVIAPYLVDELSAPDKDTVGHVLSTESFRFFGISAAVRF